MVKVFFLYQLTRGALSEPRASTVESVHTVMRFTYVTFCSTRSMGTLNSITGALQLL